MYQIDYRLCGKLCRAVRMAYDMPTTMKKLRSAGATAIRVTPLVPTDYAVYAD